MNIHPPVVSGWQIQEIHHQLLAFFWDVKTSVKLQQSQKLQPCLFLQLWASYGKMLVLDWALSRNALSSLVPKAWLEACFPGQTNLPFCTPLNTLGHNCLHWVGFPLHMPYPYSLYRFEYLHFRYLKSLVIYLYKSKFKTASF